MAITVTATQGGSTANGLGLRVFVLTGAKGRTSQAGAAPNASIVNSTTYTVAGTITATSSFVYGAVVHSNVVDTGSGVTVVDDIADATNGERYCTFKQLAPSSGSQTLGTTTSTSSGGVAWLEVQAAATLAEDASAPAVVSSTSAITVTTASFTPPGGALLVALVSSDGGAAVTTMTVSDSSSLTWTEKTKANGTGNDYCGVWIADAPAATAVTYTPPRYGQVPQPSPAPWAQRDRRDANTVATAANPLVSPLDTAWQADAGYWHLYSDSALRDRRQYFQQRPLVSDPNLLQPPANADPLALNPEQSNSSGLWRAAIVPAFYDRREVPQQRTYYDPSLLATALLENELLGGGQTWIHGVTAAYYDRREVPQQRAYISDPSFYPIQQQVGAGTTEAWWGADTDAFYHAQRLLVSDPNLLVPPPPFDPTLGGQDDLGRRQRQAATHADRREVPQQRAYISDPSFYPTTAPTDPLTIAWGAGGSYWHLYERASDITDRRAYFTQRLYVSDPLLLTTAELENELLGGSQTWLHYVTAAYYDRREVPQQRPYVSDPSLLTTALLENELLGGAQTWAHAAAAAYCDRREVPQQRAYVSDPLLLSTAELENELLGGAGTAMRYLVPATHADRREVPQQRAYPDNLVPPVLFDPVLGAFADLARRYGLPFTHADRRLYPQQRVYFPVPPPPPALQNATSAATVSELAGASASVYAPGAGTVYGPSYGPAYVPGAPPPGPQVSERASTRPAVSDG